MRFKNLERKLERESPKRSIATSSGLGLLQMVSKPDTGGCVNEEAKPQRDVDTRWCASEDAGLRKGVDCEVLHRLEREMKHSL